MSVSRVAPRPIEAPLRLIQRRLWNGQRELGSPPLRPASVTSKPAARNTSSRVGSVTVSGRAPAGVVGCTAIGHTTILGLRGGLGHLGELGDLGGERLGHPPAVVVRGVERHRRHPQDVRLAGIGDHSVPVPQPPGEFGRAAAAEADGELAAAPGRIARRDHAQRPVGVTSSSRSSRYAVSRWLRSRSAVMPTLSKIASEVRTGPRARIGGLDTCQAAASAGGPGHRGHLEPGLRLRAPPAVEARQVAVGEVALVDERAGQRARAGVEVLVRAPGREVDVPVVQLQRHVPGRVREVPAHDRAGARARPR